MHCLYSLTFIHRKLHECTSYAVYAMKHDTTDNISYEMRWTAIKLNIHSFSTNLNTHLAHVWIIIWFKVQNCAKVNLNFLTIILYSFDSPSTHIKFHYTSISWELIQLFHIFFSPQAKQTFDSHWKWLHFKIVENIQACKKLLSLNAFTI